MAQKCSHPRLPVQLIGTHLRWWVVSRQNARKRSIPPCWRSRFEVQILQQSLQLERRTLCESFWHSNPNESLFKQNWITKNWWGKVSQSRKRENLNSSSRSRSPRRFTPNYLSCVSGRQDASNCFKSSKSNWIYWPASMFRPFQRTRTSNLA